MFLNIMLPPHRWQWGVISLALLWKITVSETVRRVEDNGCINYYFEIVFPS